MGLGGCLVARAQLTMESDYAQESLKKNDFPDGYTGYFHVVVGYPLGKTLTKERKDRITFVKNED